MDRDILQWFTNFSDHDNHLESMIMMQFTGSHPHILNQLQNGAQGLFNSEDFHVLFWLKHTE